VAVNGKFAREDPAAAGKVTRALLKGAKWVGVNPTAAAKLAVEKNYVAATMEVNAQAIGTTRPTSKPTGVSSGEPTRSETTADGARTRVTPVPVSTTAVTRSSVFIYETYQVRA
jgi:NitT/TauT family transport system substrate-binding protein